MRKSPPEPSRFAFHLIWMAALTAIALLPHSIHGNPRPRPRAAVQNEVPARLPSPVEFREDSRRGLLVKTWVNGVGPLVFAIDTGAGMTIIASRTAARAGMAVMNRTVLIQGASETGSVRGRLAGTTRIALGGPDNPLPSRGKIAVVDAMPSDLDGILDPTEAFAPLGYVIDFPESTISAFDPGAVPLGRRAGASVVGWMNEADGRRPFVRINDRYPALIDTGARFGLALPMTTARELGVLLMASNEGNNTRDVVGGRIRVTRARPISVRVEGLALDRIPTDVLLDAGAGTPILLGRDALRPFRISFDPRRKVIEFLPPRGEG